MIFHIFILVILYFVEAFIPSVNGLNDYIDVQNSLAERSANVLRKEDYNSNMKIRLKGQAESSGIQIKSKLQRRRKNSKL